MSINISKIEISESDNAAFEDFTELFSELEALEPFEIKKEELAAHMAALLSFSKTSRTELSIKTGWKKSRVTNILNGSKNLTFKTIWEFAQQLGYEADVTFRSFSEMHAMQPWHKDFYSSYFHMATTEELYEVSTLVIEAEEDINEYLDTPQVEYKGFYFNSNIKQADPLVIEYKENKDRGLKFSL